MKTIDVHSSESAASKAEIADLLHAIGARITLGGSWLLDCGEVSETVIIFSLPPNAEGSLRHAVETAVSSGQRAVGIWRKGTVEGRLPGAFADYGGAVVEWSVEKLRQVICDQMPAWEDPGGSARAQQDTDRNKC